MEKVSGKYYHPVTVTHIEYFTPLLKLVRFEGEISRTNFIAANVVEFRVSETDYRHYTPSLYDAEKQVCEVIFYLHDQGPGSKWAEALRIGDSMKLIGPGGKMSYLPEYKRHVVFGDETALGLMICMEQAVVKNGQTFLGIAELESGHLDWIKYLNSEATKAVESSFENPAQPAVDLMSSQEQLYLKDLHSTCFYLTGRAKSIQQIKKFLTSKGVSSKQIKTYPYWAEGKKGL